MDLLKGLSQKRKTEEQAEAIINNGNAKKNAAYNMLSDCDNTYHNENMNTRESEFNNPDADKTEYIRNMVYRSIDDNNECDDYSLLKVIDKCISEYNNGSIISIEERERLLYDIFNSIRKMGILQELLDDDTITEIMVNGSENIFIEQNGHLKKWDKQFKDKDGLDHIARKIAALSDRIVNESVPIADTRLKDGSRVNIVLPPIALDGPVITIRKFYDRPLTIERLIKLGSVTKEAAEFLQKAVKARYNIFISGGTGSGKTTFLNALSNYIPSDERVITIEDSAELQIKNVSNLVRLEARNANVEGKNEITIRDLIKSSLRMRPDRIIVGEVRGAEAIDMLQAMNTGHSGSISTGHSNSAKDMLTRIETMVIMGMDIPVIAVKQQIESAIDIIVHLSRMRDKTRKVVEISEVAGIEDGQICLNTLYAFEEDDEDENGKVMGSLKRSGNALIRDYKMRSAGIREW